MDFDTLRRLAEKHDVVITSYEGHHRTPPHYFASLRNAFGFYFNTFNTKNSSYNFYAEGLSAHSEVANSSDFLDEENTVLAIVAFERFFELFIKNILKASDHNLAHSREDRKRIKTRDLLTEISSSKFVPRTDDGVPFTIPFSETLRRFYDLIDLHNEGYEHSIVENFSHEIENYRFFDSAEHHVTLKLINWYRDRILHNGSKLPSLWMLDYFVTQRLLPMIFGITEVDKHTLGESLFYFKTLSGINVIEKLNGVRYEFDQLYDPERQRETYRLLLYIGHLKELGRANLNMNLYMRNNSQATYEYNYRDPKARGRRFARVEMEGHIHAIRISPCICCAEESMVVYQEIIDDIFRIGSKKSIEWVKCYTCDYHIRYNVGDPSIFSLHPNRIFT